MSRIMRLLELLSAFFIGAMLVLYLVHKPLKIAYEEYPVLRAAFEIQSTENGARRHLIELNKLVRMHEDDSIRPLLNQFVFDFKNNSPDWVKDGTYETAIDGFRSGLASELSYQLAKDTIKKLEGCLALKDPRKCYSTTMDEFKAKHDPDRLKNMDYLGLMHIYEKLPKNYPDNN